MTLHQLRTFVAVADTGSVRAAAGRLVVTQPAVSGALRALQVSLGVALVEPDGRGLRLTAAGRTFAEYARRVLGLLEQGRLAATGSDDPARGRLRIAAVTTASEHVLPRSLAVFRDRYPDVEVTLDVGNRDQVWTWMARGDADVALAGRPPKEDDLIMRASLPNELVVVSAPALVPEREPTTLSMLADRTWLLREPGSGTRLTLVSLLAREELEVPSLTLGSNGAVVAGAVAGLGVTLISRIAVSRELATGELVEISTPVTPVERPWFAVAPRRGTPTAELFIADLVDLDRPHPLPRFRPATEG